MTHIFFVRHAQPEADWQDDRTKPLTPRGVEDSKKVTAALAGIRIDAFLASPYKRSVDTIAECAAVRGMPVRTDERFRERRHGGGDYAQFLEQRWRDFSFCEPGGETLGSVSARNVEALQEVLAAHEGENIVIGTHGTALSTILNYYDPAFGCAEFVRIWHTMPYIVRLDFDGPRYLGRTEVLWVDSEH